MFNFVCQARPRSALPERRCRLGSRAGPLSAAPSQRRPRTAGRDPRPPRYLPQQQPQPQPRAGRGGAQAAPRPPRRPPAGPGLAAGRPAPAEPPPSEERQEQNHKFRLIKHLLILQKLSRPLRNPPETCAAPVIFCYIIFLVKYFPRQSPQRGSNITVTNRNQCALTY